MQTLGLTPEPKPVNRFRELLWPEIKDEVSALTAARNGMYAGFVVAAFTALSVFAGAGKEGLIDSTLFVMTGIGTRQMSRTASVTGLVLYVLGQILRISQGMWGVRSVLFAIALTAVLASAVR